MRESSTKMKSSKGGVISSRADSEDHNLAASTDAFSKYKFKNINSPPHKIQIKLNKDACTFSNFNAKLEKEESRYRNLTRNLEVNILNYTILNYLTLYNYTNKTNKTKTYLYYFLPYLLTYLFFFQFDNMKILEKDKIISDLQEELRKLSGDNETKIQFEEKDLHKRKITEASTKKIAHYCNDLKHKFENIVETMQMFENTINTLKKDHLVTVKKYEEKIDRKSNDLLFNICLLMIINNNFVGHDKTIQVNNLEFLKKKIDVNRNVIRDLEVKMDNVKNMTEDQKNVFLEKEMLNKIKYDETEKKLSDYQKKVIINLT